MQAIDKAREILQHHYIRAEGQEVPHEAWRKERPLWNFCEREFDAPTFDSARPHQRSIDLAHLQAVKQLQTAATLTEQTLHFLKKCNSIMREISLGNCNSNIVLSGSHNRIQRSMYLATTINRATATTTLALMK